MNTNVKVPSMIMDMLGSFPLLKVLHPQEWDALAAVARLQVIPKQTFIYREGQPSDELYFLARGIVKIGAHSGDGREVIKQLVHPVTVFGELGLVGEAVRDDFAITQQSEVSLYAVPTAFFRELIRGNHRLSMQFLEWIGDRLRHTESRLESLICKDARQRIIDFLLDAARRRGQRIGYETLIKHSLTQQDIANITGTSRQTVTSVLNDLRKANLIHFNRRSILIRDLSRLG